MAVDEAMMHAIIVGNTLPTLRLYQWEGFAISVGRFQNIARTMRAASTEEDGLSLVRRVTGGRGILHGDDLTISIACRSSDLGVSSQVSVASVYSILMGIFRLAFAHVGIDAIQGLASRFEPGSKTGDCFAIASQADLIHKGSGVKLLGGALHRREDAVLFQASVPLHTASCSDRVQKLAARSFQGGAAEIHHSGLNSFSLDGLENAVVTSLCQHLCARVAANNQSEFETNVTDTLQETRYGNKDWTNSGRSIGDLDPN